MALCMPPGQGSAWAQSGIFVFYGDDGDEDKLWRKAAQHEGDEGFIHPDGCHLLRPKKGITVKVQNSISWGSTFIGSPGFLVKNKFIAA